MGLNGKILISVAVLAAFTSCADKGPDLKEAMPPPGLGPAIRSKAGGTPVLPGGNNEPAISSSVPRKDIVFTDPDNPDAGIPELENLMTAPKRGPWEESEAIARQTAVREGKPILLWFTDSARSPMCKALAAELFSTPEFGKWAEENLVRLRVDSNVSVDDPDISLNEKITRQSVVKTYVKDLKKRYKVLGHPTVLVLNPGGEVVWRDTGYKRGEADYFWGLLKQANVAASHAYKGWRRDLENKGYREWEGKRGKKVFAKLVKYSEGNLILIEPGGERFKTHESKLSSKDRDWISKRKELHRAE